MRVARKAVPRGAEEGFSLIEVMIALAVFVIVSVSALSLLLTATSAARGNSRKTVATSLASRQIESARSQRALDIPDGALTRTETVSGVTYTINQTAGYVADDSAVSLCSGGAGRLAYKLVTVTVTWPGMGATPPVRADTLRALGTGTDGLDGANAVVAVAVRTGLDAVVPGVQVTLNPGAVVRTTGTDGCAVFVGLTPGGYTVAPSAAGHVDSVNSPAPPATSVTTTAGAVARTTLLYDAARSVATTVGGPDGYLPPTSGLPLTVRSSYLTARTLPACPGSGTQAGCVSGNPPTVTGVFPAVYSLWLGTCLDAGGTPATVDLSATPAPTSAAVPAAAVLVDVQVLGASTPDRVVTATHAADPAGFGGCPGGESYTLPPTVAGGPGPAGTSVLLPYGSWTFTTAGAPPVTVTLGAAPTTVTLAATA